MFITSEHLSGCFVLCFVLKYRGLNPGACMANVHLTSHREQIFMEAVALLLKSACEQVRPSLYTEDVVFLFSSQVSAKALRKNS